MATMMMNVSSLAAIVAGLSLAVGYSAVEERLVPPEPRYLALGELSYSDGEFTQMHVTSRSGIQANWTAKIMQDNRIVCPPGNGRGTYQNIKPVSLSVDLWVGADVLGYSCESRLEKGAVYTGLASWEYLNGEGQQVTIIGEIEFVY